MELVKGVPITDYCDKCKLTPQQRLELFVPVCQAIQHAHLKGIIHRDIKPSNVMVTLYDDRPVPKVIDFGVAKATGGTLTEHTIDTGFGSVVGTPEYMSPEQATFNNLDIDTRSDVYGLGALLYKLLTGSAPFSRKQLEKKGLLEMLRVVREEEPPRPSTKLSTADALPTLSANRGTEPRKLTALLRNELDWIVMKALEKDRSRRYETANGLAADVLRYLAGEPVQAHPPSTAYRLRKFVRRHRGQVIAASLVLLALLGGLSGTTWGLIEARRAKEREAEQRSAAEAEKDRAIDFRNQALDALRATTGTDVEKLLGAKKELSATEKAYLEAIAGRWQAFAQQEGSDEQSRAVRAEGHVRVAYLWHKLGRREEARPEYERALAIREKLAADFPTVPDYRRDLAGSHNNLGNLLKDLGKQAEAEQRYKKALAIREKLVADFPTAPDHRRDLALSHNNLGNLLRDLGKRTEAEQHYKKALAIQDRVAADFPTVPDYRRELAGSHNNLGNLLKDLGKRTEAEQQYKRALLIHEKLAAEFPTVLDYRSDLAGSHNNLGLQLASLGKRTKAEQQLKKALAIREKLADDFPTVPAYRVDLGGSYCNFGHFVLNGGKPADSLAWFQKAIDTLRPVHEQQPRDVTARLFLRNSHWARAGAHDRLEQFAEAVKEWDRAIQLSARSQQAGLRARRANSQVRAGQVAEAVAEVAALMTPGANANGRAMWNAGQWYQFASIYAVASGKVADK
jgi:tetratricopeptide (TPR) repeat protein